MAQQQAYKIVKPFLDQVSSVEAVEAETKPENIVVFTSYDGTIREVGDLPSNLGRATALASQQANCKVKVRTI